jgi:EAL domain-containing protein (putative c-di-GMP-specific phosphodiesterase class I)
VKIDQSFVFELGVDVVGSAIVAAVTGLAHALGLTVVAEGVETRDHLAALVNLDCDLAQGAYFAPALDAVSATHVLHDGVDVLRVESA